MPVDLWSVLTADHLAEPWFLALLAPLALVVVWQLGRRRAAVDGGSERLLAGLPRTLTQRTAWLPGALLVAAAVLLIVALARPQKGRQETKVITEGVDILLVVDISSSMTKEGLEAGSENIEVVKRVVRRFADGRADDRLGLISFAKLPRTVCPLTLDNDAIAGHLRDLECVQTNGPDDGTAIGAALGHAARKLMDSDAETKLVLLLTDGVENQMQILPEEAAALCADLGIRVYTIGAGVNLVRDIFGNVREVELETAMLEHIAEVTDGRFYRARSASVLEQVYAEIDQLETTEREDVRYTDYDDLYQHLLLPAAALLALALLLGRGPYQELGA